MFSQHFRKQSQDILIDGKAFVVIVSIRGRSWGVANIRNMGPETAAAAAICNFPGQSYTFWRISKFYIRKDIRHCVREA